MIQITNAAKKMLVSSWKNGGKKYLELGVKSGGCSGFKYYLKPSNDKQKFDEVIKINEAKLEIDWKEDLMGNRFVFNNPNSTIKCGCGESFG